VLGAALSPCATIHSVLSPQSSLLGTVLSPQSFSGANRNSPPRGQHVGDHLGDQRRGLGPQPRDPQNPTNGTDEATTHLHAKTQRGRRRPTPPRRPATPYAAEDTKPSTRSAEATPRSPPPPRSSSWPEDGSGAHTATGTDTRHDGRTGAPRWHGRTTTERPNSAAWPRANAQARENSAKDATATRPDNDRDETRHDTNEHEPARKADHTTDEKQGTNEATTHLRSTRRSPRHSARRHLARTTSPAPARPAAAAHAPLIWNAQALPPRNRRARVSEARLDAARSIAPQGMRIGRANP